ncbi:muscarinic acetylcholine receptor M1-like [Haliotis rufescens]|uniref:muscarinic acetylcholine receptor M1-like n=1 Tax=Haliotis rufescens TaxID=6454 RepID=UPI00201EEA89|nr:muscarinic acetylcholine receptor M1-like [Haliotis rufescens]
MSGENTTLMTVENVEVDGTDTFSPLLLSPDTSNLLLNSNTVTSERLFVTSLPENMTQSFEIFDNITDIDYGRYLQSLNDSFARLMLPAISYLSVLMVFGIIGNILVLYIYVRKLKHNTTRSFVLALASFDLLGCTVAIPGEIIDLMHNYTFGSYIACNLLRTVNSFSSFASGFTLFVVAVDRYKMICNPLGNQISTKSANLVLLGCCLVSMGLSAPAALLYGSRAVPTGYSWVNGSDCSTKDRFIGTLFPLIYNGVQFLFFVIGALGLMSLYSHIGRRIWRHRRFKVTGQAPSSFFIRCSDSGSETSPATDDCHATGFISPSGHVPNDVPRDRKQNGTRKPPRKLIVKTRKCSSVSGMSGPSSPESLSPESPTFLVKPEVNRKVSRDQNSTTRKVSMRRGTLDRRQSVLPNLSKRETNALRTTLMLFLITLIFILSFLPHLVLMTIKALDSKSLSGSGDLAEVAFNIGLRSYFINSVANPIVYSLCCQKFRSELVKISKCACDRK